MYRRFSLSIPRPCDGDGVPAGTGLGQHVEPSVPQQVFPSCQAASTKYAYFAVVCNCALASTFVFFALAIVILVLAR